MSGRVPVGVLVSGGGSNLGAILEATRDPAFPAQVAVVISNQPDAGGLKRAEAAGVPAIVCSHRGWSSRAAYDAALVEILRAHGVQWVALAGFMRVVTSTLLSAFPGRVLNIHPALLPAFPGLHAQEQAFRAGVRVAGATVHLVDEGTDTGPILAQGAVPVLAEDTADSLAARILTVEHRLYPMVLRWAAEGRINQVDGRVHLDLEHGDNPWLWRGPT